MAGHRSGAGSDRRVVLVCGDAFFHDHRHQQADLHRHAVAAARAEVRERIPAIRIDRRGDRSADAGTGRQGERCLDRAPVAAEGFVPFRPAAARRCVLRAERLSLRIDRSARAATEKSDPGAAPGAGAGGRPEPARRDPGAAIRLARRAGRPHHARRHDLADDAWRRRHREGQCRAAGDVFLARPGPRPCLDGKRAAKVSQHPGRARLFGARARIEGDRCHPQGCRRSQVRDRLPGEPAPDRPGALGGRRIRHHQGERRAERHRHHCHRAVHSVAGAALVPHHLCRVRQSRRWAGGHGGGRHADGRHAEPDIGVFRGAVRRPRRRFRIAVQRALSRRAARGRRPARGLAVFRPPRRRAADACRARHRRRLPVVPADRLQGRVRARPHCRRRHVDRVLHQHHLAAGFVEPAQAAERAAAISATPCWRRSTVSWNGIACRS